MRSQSARSNGADRPHTAADVYLATPTGFYRDISGRRCYEPSLEQKIELCKENLQRVLAFNKEEK